MELKRILAKDARSANEKAVALYGPEVMVISCNKVDHQMELIVAIDRNSDETAPMLTQQATAPASQPPVAAALTPFEDFLVQARQTAAQQTQIAQPAIETSLPSVSVKEQAPTVTFANEEAGRVRGQELVSLVRDEIASLRREFQLTRLHQDVAGASALPNTLRPLLDALIDCHVPSALRAWLLEETQEGDDHQLALHGMRTRLNKSLTIKRPKSLMGGVHALVGTNGVGKTMMMQRIVMAASREHATEDIALISFNDNKPGAWGQIQILAAQTGVNAYRAKDLSALGVLIEELGDRKLILIDTPGSDHLRHAEELAKLDKHIALHAVMAANASTDQFRKLLSSPVAWQSLMISKWDDTPNPWPLIEFLRTQPMSISALSDSDRFSDGLPQLDTTKLVELAIFKLEEKLGHNLDLSLTSSLKTAPAKTSTRVTKPRASRAVKPAAKTVKPASKITCLQ